jgi:aminomethyltransferase
MAINTKTTPLNTWHRDHGANMADFGGYDMPLWYSSVKEEHLAVLTGAGVFDTTHMAAVTVIGSGAAGLLQQCFTNDLDACMGPSRHPLLPGRCVYGAFLDDKGRTIDDAIVFFVETDSYMVVVNAGMGGAVAAHLQHHTGSGTPRWSTSPTDWARWTFRDRRRPESSARCWPIPKRYFPPCPTSPSRGILTIPLTWPMSFALDDGTPILLSRTGYTGEFGFEIFLAPDKIRILWERLLAAGEAYHIRPCGLAARDSLRAGAVLPLSHQDIGHWPFINHPWPFALPFTADQTGFTKDFIGRTALEKQLDAAFTHAFVGNDLRKISAGEGSRVIDADGQTIGRVLTCATDMGIGAPRG